MMITASADHEASTTTGAWLAVIKRALLIPVHRTAAKVVRVFFYISLVYGFLSYTLCTSPSRFTDPELLRDIPVMIFTLIVLLIFAFLPMVLLYLWARWLDRDRTPEAATAPAPPGLAAARRIRDRGSRCLGRRPSRTRQGDSRANGPRPAPAVRRRGSGRRPRRWCASSTPRCAARPGRARSRASSRPYPPAAAGRPPPGSPSSGPNETTTWVKTTSFTTSYALDLLQPVGEPLGVRAEPLDHLGDAATTQRAQGGPDGEPACPAGELRHAGEGIGALVLDQVRRVHAHGGVEGGAVGDDRQAVVVRAR